VNTDGGFGRWAFLEMTYPYDDVVELVRVVMGHRTEFDGSFAMSSTGRISRHGINLPMDQIAKFCRRWKIRELAVFGSFLRDDFDEHSDIDLLVDPSPGVAWTLENHFEMQEKMAKLLGRGVDLVERSSVERSRNYIRRRHILGTAEPIQFETS
jgi:predicted nucleotidyltransferase